LGATKQHVWCDSLEELTRQTEARADTPDVYFAVSSFSEPTRRTADNALLSRAFYFDIDAGPAKFAKHGDKVYPTRDAAIQAAVQWCRIAGVVPGYIIASGAGLHVYFLLEQEAPISEWLPVAVALKAMALAQGLRIDPAVTSDSARILRPVGSLHNNGERVRVLGGGPRRYTLEAMWDLVKVYAPTPPRRRERSINDDILEAPTGPPKSAEKIGGRCEAMKHAMRARGNVAEPYWRAMLGVIKHTVEGVAAAHQYSEGHPEYNPTATEEKFHRWAAGPATCATFEAENPQACAGCEWRGKIKSPITLGELEPPEVARMAPAAVDTEPEDVSPLVGSAPDQDAEPDQDPWSGCMPKGFRVAPAGSGFVMIGRQKILTVNDVGDKVEVEVDVPFAAVPLWFESWAPGTNANDQAQAIYCTYDVQRRRVDRYTFPTRLAAKSDTMFGALAEQNIQVYPSTKNARTAMEDFVKASLERIRTAGQRPKISDRFGSAFDSQGRLIIAQGRHLISPSGEVMEGVVQERLRARGRAYCVPLPENPKGVWGPEVWDEYIAPRAKRHVEYLQEFYGDDNFRPYQLAIMLSLASPMLAFMEGAFRPGTDLPAIGLTVSLYSPRSGIGKTSAMTAAALAFGNPSAICLQLDSNNSTDNARQGIMVQSGTLPCFMDEMEDVPAKTLANIVSSTSNGTVKQRLHKDASLVETSRIALINIMSTNKSHRELVAAARAESNATQVRMLEIDCSDVQYVSQERRLQESLARSQVQDCAGALGAMIHYAMAQAGHEELSRTGVECAGIAAELLNSPQDGRFMVRVFGAMLAVRRILKRAGLLAFTKDDLLSEFRRWHDAGYDFSGEHLLPSGGPELMAMLLSDLAGSTLITSGENRTRGPHAEFEVPLNDHIPHNVVARSVLSGGYVYVKSSAIKEWCEKRQVSPVSMLRRCREAGVLESVAVGRNGGKTSFQVDLFKGTKLARGVRDSVVQVWTSRLPGEVLQAPAAGNVVPFKPNTDSPGAPQGTTEQTA
jgi:hypothetical protein